MIRAEGFVIVLVKDEQTYQPNDIFFQNKNLIVKVKSLKKVLDSQSNPAIELTCTYKINLQERYYCHTPNDYVGHVFPALRKHISPILLTQVLYIDKAFNPELK